MSHDILRPTLLRALSTPAGSTVATTEVVESPTSSADMKHKQSIYLEDWVDKHSKKDFQDRVVLYYCPEMKSVAIEVAVASNGRVLLGNIEWKRFPDHFPNLHIDNAPHLKYVDCAFLASLHSTETIFDQIAVIHSLPRHAPKSLKIVVPYFSTGTMERVISIGEVATASTLARLLSMTPMAANGPCQFAFLDIHTLQNQFYFGDQVLIRLRSAIPILLREMKKLVDNGETLQVAFPDDGAKKRFGKRFSVMGFELIVCDKVRVGDKRVVKIKEGSPDCKGNHVVIVDDLVQSGGTMAQCAKALYAQGAGKVSGYCTHSIFPNDAHKKFLHDADKGTRGLGNFENFWICNSHPRSKDLKDKPPFKVLSIAPIVGDFVLDGFGLDDA